MPTIADDVPGDPTPAKRRFAIVSTAAPERVLELFEAPGWVPAVMVYAEKIRAGKFAEPAMLRVARDTE